ncbi:MAG: ATP-binding protein [Bacteroidota bacterium]
MKNKKIILLGLISVVLFSATFVLEKVHFSILKKEIKADQVESVLHAKEIRVKEQVQLISRSLQHGIESDSLKTKLLDITGPLHESGILYLVYYADSLAFWSDNTVNFPVFYKPDTFDSPCIFLSNGWFVVKNFVEENKRIIALILIKRQYPYQNEFVQNDYLHHFGIKGNPAIIPANIAHGGSIPVKGYEGDHLFSLEHEKEEFEGYKYILTSWLFLSGLLIFLFFLSQCINSFRVNKVRTWSIVLTLFILAGIRFVMVYFRIPNSIYSLGLFSPEFFAASSALPSLGDLLLNSVFIFFIVFNCCATGNFPVHFNKRRKELIVLSHLLFAIGATLFYYYGFRVFKSLIFNSDITFEAHNLLEINLYSFVGLLSVGLLIAAYGLFTRKIIQLFSGFFTKKYQVAVFIIALMVIFIYDYLESGTFGLPSFLFGIAFTVVIIQYYYKTFRFRYSFFVFIVLVFSVFSTVFIRLYNKQKEKEDRRVLVMNLAVEHDPVAELLLEDIIPLIERDQELNDLMFAEYFNYDDVYDYIRRNFYSGYFNKYDLQLTLCTDKDSVLIEPEMQWKHCYSFFDTLLEESGGIIPADNFYFLDIPNGRIGYLGIATLENTSPRSEDTTRVTLFMQIDSRLLAQELGYPELLLDENYSGYSLYSRYSYAKYNKGVLITQSGTFPYRLKDPVYQVSTSSITHETYNGYKHTVYKPDEENLIILSKPQVTFFEILVSFSYIFIFYFVLTTIFLLATDFSTFQKAFAPNFKNRIQYSMIGILFLSLFLVGGGAIYFSIQQYKAKHNEILREKIQSVYIELVHKLEHETSLKRDWSAGGYDNLDQLLIKFSNVFYTDINLYDESGDLLATSRNEIFSKELLGSKMNPEAFIELSVNNRAEFLMDEQIGKLSYLSAYVPFTNREKKLLAYLNLPYFTRQGDLTREISSLVVAVINVYVLLILLSVTIAVIIAGKITRPMGMLQRKFSELKLGRKYEKLDYKGNDEIGQLVREYNRMVTELEESVKLLAKTEREIAWREMAKQIAHEIKNPLTPMKLHIQHLKRSWREHQDDMDNYLKNFSEIMIGQIDNLSLIATEFSNFAKMPRTKLTRVYLVERINTASELFRNSENLEIIKDFSNLEHAFIEADSEQINRVFINLLKNASQSIPTGLQGIVVIEIKKHDEFYEVRVSDNGSGIPAEMRDKLFQPNFTTKSGGKGLGLAIVKSIVESSGGNIDYRTIVGKGTTFVLQFPMLR